MSRMLYTGSRCRVLDSNGNPFSNEIRLTFWDSSTSTVKEVFAGPLEEDSSLGSEVVLDAEGWGPYDGIWLNTGIYNVGVEERTYNNQGSEIWNLLWMIHKVPGAAESVVSEIVTGCVETVNGVRSFDTTVPIVFNTGYYADNDGGQGEWHFVADSMEEDDGGAYLKPLGQSGAVPGRWHRIMPLGGSVDVRLWGAITGAGDTASNIGKAQEWCARTVPETGITLEFPAGQYAIGADISLNASGIPATGEHRKVNFHFAANSVFASTSEAEGADLNATVYVENPCTVEGSGKHATRHVSLSFADAVNGGLGVRPEWWGADPSGVSASDLYFQRCWLGRGRNPVLLDNDYLLAMGDIIRKSPDSYEYPPLVCGADASITFATSSNAIDIGEIRCDSRTGTGPMFKGELDAMLLYGNYVESAWFDIGNITRYKQFSLACDAAPKELKWTLDYHWGGDFNNVSANDGGYNTLHTFGATAMWYLEDSHVQVALMRPPDRHFIAAQSGKTGTLNVGALWEIKAQWFGAEGLLIDDELDTLMRSVLKYNNGVVFSDTTSTVNSDHSYALRDNYNLRIRNLRLFQSDGTKALLGFTDNGPGSNTGVHFRNCELGAASGTPPQALLSTAVDNLLVEDCYLSGGTLSVNNRGSVTVRNVVLANCPSFFLTNSSLLLLQGNKHTDSRVEFYGNTASNTFANILSHGNCFTRSTGSYDIGFVAAGTKVLASNVKIDNVNCTVLDLTAGSNGTWFNAPDSDPFGEYTTHHHDIAIAGQTDGQTDYGPYNSQSGWDTLACPPGAFRLHGVTSSELRVQSATGRYFGNTVGSMNSPAVDPLQVWFGDWISSDGSAPLVANGRFNLGYQFMSNPSSFVNQLTAYIRVNWRILL